MSTKIEICNIALAMVGRDGITSLSDGTKEAKLCNSYYDQTARTVMSKGAWTSTIVRKELARLSETPAYGFNYMFQLPVNPKILRVLDIQNETGFVEDYVIEGDKLLIDSSQVKIRYVSELTDPTKYGTLLTDVIILALASNLAYPITHDLGLKDLLQSDYLLKEKNNLAIDNKQNSITHYYINDLINVR